MMEESPNILPAIKERIIGQQYIYNIFILFSIKQINILLFNL